MATNDSCCTIVPYFKVHDGQLDRFKQLCDQFVAKASNETGCLYYGFTFNGDQVHCREGYANAEGALYHLQNVDALLQEALSISDITKLEVHGPEEELDKLRDPLSGFNPEYWVLEYGFRN